MAGYGFKLNGFNASESLLGARPSTIGGMPAADLVGLYLLRDGVVSSLYPATVTDSSGEGNDGTFFGGAANATRTDGGAAAASLGHGWAVNTGIPFAANMSCVVVARQLVGEGPSMGVPTWVGPTTGLNATWTGSQAQNKGVTLGINLGIAVTGYAPALRAGTGTPFAGGTSATLNPAVPGISAQVWGAMAVSMNGSTNEFIYSSPGANALATDVGYVSEVNATAMGLVNTSGGNWAFGVMKRLTDQVKGEVALFAVYDAVKTAEELLDIRFAAIAVAEGRRLDPS
jgi:hypothetical protein